MTTDGINDSLLLAYLENEVDPIIAKQIEDSAVHLARVQQLAREQEDLKNALFRLDCPETVTLGEYYLNMLSNKETEALNQHLAICPHCNRELVRFGYDLEQAEESEETLTARITQRIKVIIAQLVNGIESSGKLGSPTLTPAFSVRGSESEPLIFEVEQGRIALTIQDDIDRPGYKVIVGLLSGISQPEMYRIHGWLDDQPVMLAEVNELGNFTLSGLLSGEYELIIKGPEKLIQIPSLQV